MRSLTIALLLASFSASAQTELGRKISDAVQQLKGDAPTLQDPVALRAGMVTSGDSVAFIVKVVIAPGWHIYSYVPGNQPYIPIEHVLQLPENIRAVGKWEKSRPTTSVNDPGVLMYEKEALFVQKAVKVAGAKPGKTVVGLYYQACDLRQCLRPVEKTIELIN
jgi:DsbC/DsbD-like thiol-disulfide interchange protein